MKRLLISVLIVLSVLCGAVPAHAQDAGKSALRAKYAAACYEFYFQRYPEPRSTALTNQIIVYCIHLALKKVP